jgi:hypothetical protein
VGKLHLYQSGGGTNLLDKRTNISTADFRQTLNYTHYSSVAQGANRNPDNSRGLWIGNMVDENDGAPSGANFVAFTNSFQFYAVADQTKYDDSLTFTSNTDTLKYSDGDFIKVMKIDASGNVGIGTTSPNEKLEIYGNGIVIHDPSANTKIDFLRGGTLRVPNTNTFGLSDYSDWRITTSGAKMQFQNQYTGANSGNLITVMTLAHNSGNVGIGTTSPSTKLDVNGTVNTGALTATTGTFSGGVSTTTIRNNSGPIVFGNESYVNRLRKPKDDDYIIGTWKTSLDASATTTVGLNVRSCVSTPAASGSGMSGNIGRFTAPEDGYYYTYVQTIQTTRNTSNLLIVFEAGGTNFGTNNLIGTYDEIIDLRGADNVEENYNFVATLYMEAGDYIQYRVHSSGYTDSSTFHMQCSAFLLNRV